MKYFYSGITTTGTIRFYGIFKPEYPEQTPESHLEELWETKHKQFHENLTLTAFNRID
jgi:hypothetical protein